MISKDSPSQLREGSKGRQLQLSQRTKRKIHENGNLNFDDRHLSGNLQESASQVREHKTRRHVACHLRNPAAFCCYTACAACGSARKGSIFSNIWRL